jgi:hypothetical protein
VQRNELRGKRYRKVDQRELRGSSDRGEVACRRIVVVGSVEWQCEP